jgi:hypothetical protein
MFDVYGKIFLFCWISRQSPPLIYVFGIWLNCIFMTSDKGAKPDDHVTKIFVSYTEWTILPRCGNWVSMKTEPERSDGMSCYNYGLGFDTDLGWSWKNFNVLSGNEQPHAVYLGSAFLRRQLAQLLTTNGVLTVPAAYVGQRYARTTLCSCDRYKCSLAAPIVVNMASASVIHCLLLRDVVEQGWFYHFPSMIAFSFG